MRCLWLLWIVWICDSIVPLIEFCYRCNVSFSLLLSLFSSLMICFNVSSLQDHVTIPPSLLTVNNSLTSVACNFFIELFNSTCVKFIYLLYFITSFFLFFFIWNNLKLIISRDFVLILSWRHLPTNTFFSFSWKYIIQIIKWLDNVSSAR